MAVKCKELVYTPLNALTFRITGGTTSIIPHKINGIIQSLESPNGIILSLGTTAEIKRVKYKVNIIEKVIINKTIYYDVHMAKRTKSSIFVMPMLGGNRNLFFWNKLFTNCFLETPEEKNCIALLYRWSGDPLFVKFEQVLSKFKSFRAKYDPDPNYVLFVFNIPKKYKHDYELFKKGKYSQLSKSYKISILDFHNSEPYEEIGQVLYKDPKRRELMEDKLGTTLSDDLELLSIIDKKEEIFNINDYKLKKLL
tara:strand:+ start:483 stop:1241 length:759 start_codon:yes stop_codon:yes gene_type:complete